mgnify:CR=1 FL=1
MRNITLRNGLCCLAILAAAGCNDNVLKTGHFEMFETQPLAEGRTDSVTVSATIEFPESGLRGDACGRITEGIVERGFGVAGTIAGDAARHGADGGGADNRLPLKNT